jgi:phage tail-like protein
VPRKPLFSRLPQIWKRLDESGQLERFLSVIDADLDRIHLKIGELLTTRDLDSVSDKFLSLMAPYVGHIWRDDKTREWNRERIRYAIKRYSYKGTTARIEDSVKDSGGQTARIQDNFSLLMVVGKQGGLGDPDCIIMDEQFWHDGSFVLTTDYDIDWDELSLELKETLAGGELWWLQSLYTDTSPYRRRDTFKRYARFSLSDTEGGVIGCGGIGNDLGVGNLATDDFYFIKTIIDDSINRAPYSFTDHSNYIGGAVIGDDLYLTGLINNTEFSIQ